MRIRAILLIACAFFFHDVTGAYLLPVALGLLAAGSIFIRRRIELSPGRRLIYILTVSLLFSIKFRFFASWMLANALLEPHWITVSQFLLTTAAIDMLFSPHRKWQWFFPFAILLAIPSTLESLGQGAVYENATIAIVVSFTLIMADLGSWATAGPKPAKVCGSGMALNLAIALIVLIGGGYGFGMYNMHSAMKAQDRIGSLFDSKEIDSSPLGPVAGAGSSGKLITGSAGFDPGANNAVIHVYSADNPVYLRWAVYDKYKDAGWKSDDDFTIAAAQALGKQNIYNLSGGGAEVSTMQIWLDSSLRGKIFLPYYSGVLRTSARYILSNRLGTLESDGTADVYWVDYSARPCPGELKGDLRAMCLSVPLSMEYRMRKIASEIFAGCSGVDEKSAALCNFFQSGFTYTNSIEVPENREPIEFFLTDLKKGHCQMFASAGAILLRLANIPTRYVQGFVIHEYDNLNKCWIARNGCAHAWIEAWDDSSRCWKIVDPTPGGSAKAQAPGKLASLLQEGAFMWRKFWSDDFRPTFPVSSDTGKSSGRNLIKPITLIGLPALAVAILLWAVRILIALRGHRRCPRMESRLQRLIKQMDKHVMRVGLCRNDTETPEAFADRVGKVLPTLPEAQKIARWYRIFSQARYGGLEHRFKIRFLMHGDI